MSRREQIIARLKAAGARNDHAAFMRIYTDNRISYKAAMEAFRHGQKFGELIAERDAKAKGA